MGADFELLLHELVHENRNLDQFAAWLRENGQCDKSDPTIYAWFNPNRSNCHFPARLMPEFINFFQATEALDFLCRGVGMIALKIMNFEQHGNEKTNELLRKSAKLAKESAESVSSILEAIADNHISDKERARCKKEAYEAAVAAMTVCYLLDSQKK